MLCKTPTSRQRPPAPPPPVPHPRSLTAPSRCPPGPSPAARTGAWRRAAAQRPSGGNWPLRRPVAPPVTCRGQPIVRTLPLTTEGRRVQIASRPRPSPSRRAGLSREFGHTCRGVRSRRRREREEPPRPEGPPRYRRSAAARPSPREPRSAAAPVQRRVALPGSGTLRLPRCLPSR